MGLGMEVGGLGTATLLSFLMLLFPSYSSVHLSLRVLWELLRLQGSPSPRVLPRPPQEHPKVLLEQPLAHLLLDLSYGLRTLGPTPSCGAFSLTQHR